jgi:hypothetical protein
MNSAVESKQYRPVPHGKRGASEAVISVGTLAPQRLNRSAQNHE